MLTAKQNFIETITGGNPDRFVNQWEGIVNLPTPYLMSNPSASYGGGEQVNQWGYTDIWPEGHPGAFPIHNPPERILIQDIEDWRDYVKRPNLKFDDALWETCQGIWDAVPDDLALKCAIVAPGIFELCHHMRSITEILCDCMVDTEEVQDLIKYITEFELELAEGICEHLKPEGLLHHDDMGSEQNSFLPPELTAELFEDSYKEIYKYYHDHGVKHIIHHSDSYGRNLRGTFKEWGMDVWQGCMRTNNMAEMLADNDEYGLVYMGNIDNKLVDFEGWTREDCTKAAHLATDGFELGQPYIPCINQGGGGTVYKGAYECLTEEIDKINAERFGHKVEDLAAARAPFELIIMPGHRF